LPRHWQLALAVLGGNLLLQQLPVVPGWLWLLALMLGAIAWLALLAGGVISRNGAPVFAVAVIAFSLTGAAALDGVESRWPDTSGGQDVAITGWIDDFPVRDSGRTVFSLRVVDAATEVPLRRLRLSWYEPAPALRPGQALKIEARLRAPRGLANPGGFDFERWLFLERLDATGYVRSGMVDPERRISIAQRWLAWRAGLVDAIAAAVDDQRAASLITALALGERGGFDDRAWTVLQRTGTSHLVAVSGLHIGLIAALAFIVLRQVALYLGYRIARHAVPLAASLSIVPAAVYAALAGFALPTQRALLMLVVAQAILIAGSRRPLGSGLALALIAVIALDPLATLTASFWMSFGAVTLLLAAASVRRPFAKPGGRAGRIAAFCRLQWILSLGLAPLVLGFFGQLSIASVVVNLVAIPVFSLLVVPLSLLSVALIAGGGAGAIVVDLTAMIAAGSWQALAHAADFGLAAFELPKPALLPWLLAVAAATLSLPLHPLPGRRLVLLGLVPLAIVPRSSPDYAEARVTVLDVGHGLAVVIETATHRVLYDAGPLARSGFDAGAEIVLPVIAALGSGDPDLLVLSHGDSDHAGGAASLVAQYSAMDVLAGPDVDSIAARPCLRGTSWRFDGVDFTVLHPPPDFGPLGNESSCVLRIDTAGGSLLLTGDIERRAESLLANDPGIAAEVVVVPHHGSLTSSSERFVEAVGARVAIVSAGHQNRWSFPRPEVRARWEDRGALMLVTGDHGAIEVTFRDEGLEIEAWRYLRRRYWRAERAPLSGAISGSAL